MSEGDAGDGTYVFNHDYINAGISDILLSPPTSLEQAFSRDLTGLGSFGSFWFSNYVCTDVDHDEGIHSDCVYSQMAYGFLDSASLDVSVDSPSVPAVPLPASAWLFLGALGGLGTLSWRRKQRMAA